MTTKPKEVVETISLEEAEEAVMAILTNEPSEPLKVGKYPVRVVFKRPSMVTKFRQRTWASKKLKAFGIYSDSDDQNTAFFFRYWGTLNAYVVRVLVEDSKGPVKLDGKTYSDYTYDEDVDADYLSVFEKYTMEEIYNKGMSEEAFVSDAIVAHADWMESAAVPKEDDIKNS